jgi:hypothetical protein
VREKYCCLIVGGWFVLREKYYYLVAADKPDKHGVRSTFLINLRILPPYPKSKSFMITTWSPEHDFDFLVL